MAENEFKPYPGVAAVLSFLFNGLGQVYNGQINKGLMIIFISAVNMLIFVFGSIIIALWFMGRIVSLRLLILGSALFLLGLILICIVGIYSLLDAYKVACRK